ncbi:hypothetical protein N4Q63_13205 [Leclercia adecarboxylata]|uniref:Uncharacterized protein n=2 Tax=Leclercia TaxID=83654 RepID=A0A9X3YBG1_9ENTR|nr:MULTISPECIES: hypothetical protein [Leclercia]MCT9846333.1 hypothetical protein [Leclercia adecarboxylata ATCC 23216 = NBRC 102595]UGB04940.1 hypothetical protein LRS40_12830 [Leclercia sp. G3L]MBZ3801534.1 hypothetical protein [Leclercia adecarboxylata]MBZ3806032.1 hypothetical protein [Leclercia adecarboxylata]MCE9977675.1 hypothetical protein [Leclercia adecarboxylata]
MNREETHCDVVQI